eukprot:tig00020943_g16258.t1
MSTDPRSPFKALADVPKSYVNVAAYRDASASSTRDDSGGIYEYKNQSYIWSPDLAVTDKIQIAILGSDTAPIRLTEVKALSLDINNVALGKPATSTGIIQNSSAAMGPDCLTGAF